MAGIDYGMGRTNIDIETGIRYGVISQHSLASWFYDEYEGVYGEPHCPKCGSEVIDANEALEASDNYDSYQLRGCADYICHTCKHTLDSSDCYPEEPIGHELKTSEYHAIDCLDSDVMLLKSPYYTYAPFCSPCVPGAGNLDGAARVRSGVVSDENEANGRPNAHGVKTYCFNHDYFEEHKAPYRVFRVADDSEVFPASKGAHMTEDGERA